MKAFVTLTSGLMAGFVILFLTFNALTKPFIATIKTNRQTQAAVSAQAKANAEAKASLAFLTPSRQQKLNDALPKATDVPDLLGKMALSDGIKLTVSSPPSAGTSTLGQAKTLSATLIATAPSSDSLTQWLTHLESGPLVVTIKKIALTTSNGAISGVVDIGVAVR